MGNSLVELNIKTTVEVKQEESVKSSVNPVRNILSRKGYELKERIEALSTYHSVSIQKKIADLEEQYDAIQSQIDDVQDYEIIVKAENEKSALIQELNELINQIDQFV